MGRRTPKNTKRSLMISDDELRELDRHGFSAATIAATYEVPRKLVERRMARAGIVPGAESAASAS